MASVKLADLTWSKLACLKSELRLDIVLRCGQCFRWKKREETDEWIGVIKDKLWVLSQDEEHIIYKSFPKTEAGVAEAILKDYFQLKVDLGPLYKSWSKHDPIFNKVAECGYTGIRMLRQDPVENLFSFICSSNNNIQRISSMVENLCLTYGDLVATVDNEPYHRFPTIAALAQPGVESRLRELGFGYRAGYISKSAKQLHELGGEEYLYGLRDQPYEKAREKLLAMTGIGPKVADCILLMSLDQPSAIPVDTHMFQIAKKYLPSLNGYKSVTDKVYAQIGDHFRELYGEYAGWAHSVLFSADLKHLKDVEEGSKRAAPEPKAATKSKRKKK